MLHIGIIVASNRPNRYGKQIGDWVNSVAQKRDGFAYTQLDLNDIDLPFLDEPKLPAQGDYQHEYTKKWAKLVGEQDGFLIVTCEYNHGYPASLKNALDTLFAEWQHKPVGFVGYGAMGGVRAIEHLVPVVTNLDMIPQSSSGKGTYILLFQNLNSEGKFVPTAHHERSISKNLANLEKWTTAMKKIRSEVA